ncbi:MAG: riboflavin synthase [Solirubrobacteraceae bacterium]|jgi:riboflavin synthase|nr:riboflavin synthase [Solirubrobacteraceae bacterium]
MFTGLVADLGRVVSLERDADADGHAAGAHLRIASQLAGELVSGDSIAVNGVCLTATRLEPGSFAADVIAETLGRSSLGGLEAGASVNLELPLRASDRLGGHVVLGHVDGQGEVTSFTPAGVLVLEVDPGLLRYVVEKGSVALDGVSLTVAAVDDHSLSVALIPETLKRTTFGATGVGSRVNVEVDVLAKHVEKLVAA